jgi:hypothetical protein
MKIFVWVSPDEIASRLLALAAALGLGAVTLVAPAVL